jgi:hypothetical protein
MPGDGAEETVSGRGWGVEFTSRGVTDRYNPHIMWARLAPRRGVLFALLGLVLFLALDVGTASAQPTLVSPANGASFARNASITFTVNLPAGADDAEIYMGTSSATNAD